MYTWERVKSIDYRRISVVHLVKSELSPSPSEKREGCGIEAEERVEL